MQNDPKLDLETLLNLLISFAQSMLDQHGEFYPFAGVMDLQGQARVITGRTSEAELVEALKENAKQGLSRAVALCKNVQITTNTTTTDAIQVLFEHRAAAPVTAFLPYKTAEDRTVSYGELFFEGTEAQFYV